VPFGEGLKLSAEMIMATPPKDIGRMMSGIKAAELIRRLVQGRGDGHDLAPLSAPWRVIEHAESFWVQDARGQTVGRFYFRTDPLARSKCKLTPQTYNHVGNSQQAKRDPGMITHPKNC
jgi:hypothetical protein